MPAPKDADTRDIEEIAFERAEAAERAARGEPAPEPEEEHSEEPEEDPEDEETDSDDAPEDDDEEEDEDEKGKPSKAESAWFRRTRRKLTKAIQAQEKLVTEYAPAIQAIAAAKDGNHDKLLAILRMQGVDVQGLAKRLGTNAPSYAEDPRIEKLLREVEETKAKAARAELETGVSHKLKDHPVLKLPNGLASVLERVSKGTDERGGKAPNPKKVADAIVAEYREAAKALGLAASDPEERPETPRKRGSHVPAKKLDAKDKPRTEAEWEALAFARAAAAEARAKGVR